MSGLREAFDEIVADVPGYGDLDRAIQQVEAERRHRYGVVAGLVAAAAVIAVIVGVLAVTRDGNGSPEPVGPSTPTPSPTPTKAQSPRTWVDTPVSATGAGKGWEVPDPLTKARSAWIAIVTEHLSPGTENLQSFVGGVSFEVPAEGSTYNTDVPSESAYGIHGQLSLIVDPGDLDLFDDGCGHLIAEHDSSTPEEDSCSTERFVGPDGERAKVATWSRRCTSWEGDGPAPATCGDYAVAVAVERTDGLIGYVVVEGRGTPDFNPFSPAAMAAAAADPRLTLPEQAFSVPSNHVVVSVVEDHLPRYRADAPVSSATGRPGYAQAFGALGVRVLSAHVWPAGEAPRCGSSWLVECVQRRVYGADDPTTVFVGTWDEEHWADCCPRNSRAYSRQFVYVGPRHTVVVSLSQIVPQHEEGIGPALDQPVIDLLLDSRLQQDRDH